MSVCKFAFPGGHIATVSDTVTFAPLVPQTTIKSLKWHKHIFKSSPQISCTSYRQQNDTMCRGLATLPCPPFFITPGCPGFARVPERRNESHQMLLNATLRLRLSWFASLPWYWFPALGLTVGTSIRRCASFEVGVITSTRMLAVMKHTDTHSEKWEQIAVLGWQCCWSHQSDAEWRRPEGRLFAAAALC